MRLSFSIREETVLSSRKEKRTAAENYASAQQKMLLIMQYEKNYLLIMVQSVIKLLQYNLLLCICVVHSCSSPVGEYPALFFPLFILMVQVHRHYTIRTGSFGDGRQQSYTNTHERLHSKTFAWKPLFQWNLVPTQCISQSVCGARMVSICLR